MRLTGTGLAVTGREDYMYRATCLKGPLMGFKVTTVDDCVITESEKEEKGTVVAAWVTLLGQDLAKQLV